MMTLFSLFHRQTEYPRGNQISRQRKKRFCSQSLRNHHVLHRSLCTLRCFHLLDFVRFVKRKIDGSAVDFIAVKCGRKQKTTQNDAIALRAHVISCNFENGFSVERGVPPNELKYSLQQELNSARSSIREARHIIKYHLW